MKKDFKIDERIKEAQMAEIAPTYIYATELVDGYNSLINFVGKRVLVVSGSGDQLLDTYYRGADEVVPFDLNLYSKHITSLKLAAVKKLSYTDFLTFFGNEKINVGFDYNLYKKFCDSIDEQDCRVFWDEAYKEAGFDGNKVAGNTNIFRIRNAPSRKKSTEINGYLRNEQEYEKMRTIIDNKKITLENFVISDAINIADHAQKIGKFDYYNLSNVPNYILRDPTPKETADRFHSFLQKWKAILNPGGQVFYYVYTVSVAPGQVKRIVPEEQEATPAYRLEMVGRLVMSGYYKVMALEFPPYLNEDPDNEGVIIIEPIESSKTVTKHGTLNDHTYAPWAFKEWQ